MLCLTLTNCGVCYVSQYPKIFGGVSGDTEFTAIDITEYQDLIVGGWTTDSDMLGKTGTFPIVAFFNTTTGYQWGNWYDTNYDYVASIKMISPSKTAILYQQKGIQSSAF